MPNNNKTKRNKRSRNRRRRRQQTRGVTRGASRSSSAYMGGAPVAVSTDLQQWTRFEGKGDRLVMHACAAAFQFQNNTAHATSGGCVVADDGNPYQSVAIGLNNCLGNPPGGSGAEVAVGYISPIWDLIGSAFTRYKITKLIFHYEPQSTATATGRMVFGFAEDPIHPLVAPDNTNQTSSNLLAVADSIAFMPWRAWSMDVTDRVKDDKLYYTYSQGTDADVGANNAQRFGRWGAVSCVTDVVSTVPILSGVLYMETTIEFLEFCPITITRPSLVALRDKLKRHEDAYHKSKEVAKLRSTEVWDVSTADNRVRHDDEERYISALRRIASEKSEVTPRGLVP